MKVHGPMQGRQSAFYFAPNVHPEITTGTERKNLADFSKNGKSAFLMRPQLTERSDVSCLAEFRGWKNEAAME